MGVRTAVPPTKPADLQSNPHATKVVGAVPIQRDRRCMSRRSGQRGCITVVGQNFVGRYWSDESGSNNRVRKAVILGSIDEMTKPQAARRLALLIEQRGVNSAAHLERAQTQTVTFGDAASVWRDRHLVANKKPSSRRSMGCELRNHVLPQLETTPLEEVNYPTMRKLIQGWQKRGLSTKSIKNLFGIVRAVYNFHLDETAQTGKPLLSPWLVKWKKVKPITDVERESPCYEEDQMVAIVNNTNGQMRRALYAMAGGTGARSAELFALRCEDVNLSFEDGTGIVTIRRTVFEGQEFTTKSNRVRHVPIDSTVVAELTKHVGGRRFGYVFQTRNGTALRESNELPHLHDVLEKLGIPKAGFHAFRHGRCSFLVRSDVPRAVIREWLGHGSDAMIEVYSHRLGKYGKQEMQKLIPLLDSSWTQIQTKEDGASLQAVVN